MPRKADGRADHPLYPVWRGMRQRCLDPNIAKAEHYAGRGIMFAPQWEDFWTFVKDVGLKPQDGQRWTLDRIDNDGNYEPGNVRWATYSEQNANRRKLNYPVPEKCKKGHDYVPVIDSAGNRRCEECRIEHDNERAARR